MPTFHDRIFFQIKNTPIPGDLFDVQTKFFFLRAPLIGGGFVIFVLHFFFFREVVFVNLFCPMKWDDLALHYNTLQIIQRSHDCTDTQRDLEPK